MGSTIRDRGNSDSPRITPVDYVGIPVPLNLSIPLTPPCLAWRWKLRGGGYGVLNGRGAHVVAFEQTRGRTVREERQINHLCNRPFCIQPAHLYEGTAKQNSEDRQADLAGGHYPEWRAMAHQFDRALTQHHWDAPESGTESYGWGDPLECPHVDLPEMFGTRGREEGAGPCANCGAARLTLEGQVMVKRRPCGMAQPCRCMEKETEERNRWEGHGETGAGPETIDIPFAIPLHDAPRYLRTLSEGNSRLTDTN